MMQVESSLQAFFDLSPDLLCVRNHAGYFEELNKTWTEVLGWTIAELKSCHWLTFVHPDDVAATLEIENLCHAAQVGDLAHQNRYRCKDGSYRWLSWRLSPYQAGLSYGLAQNVTAKIWDVSQGDRAGMIEALNLREQAIAASSVGIVLADARLPNMPLIYVNPAFERMTGYTSTEVVGTNCRFLQGQDRDQDAIKELRLAIKTEKSCTVILRNYRKDGMLFWNELHISPIHNDHGKLTHFIGVQTDISDRVTATEALRIETEKSERLLLNILPKKIAEKLKQYQVGVTRPAGEEFIAENFDEVTILFADIVNFTQLSAQLSAQDLVVLLNLVFSVFDELCEKHGLEKIKTIGDAYMVVGGVPLHRDDHAEAIADMALDMLQKIVDLSHITGKALNLRIGINTGAVVAGVIGTHKFIYDLWGDAVNVASRMESQGEAGKIQVTEATYLHLQERYIFKQRGAITIKGKGKMITYWLMGRK